MSENLSVEINSGSENHCSIHQGEVIYYLCTSHDALCCLKCHLKDHKDCNIVDIEAHEQETLDRNSQHLLDELKHIEEHLLKYIEENKTNLQRLHQDVQNVLTSIKTAKDNVLKLITQFERIVERQTNLVFHKEYAKKSEEIQHCQSILAEVETSTRRLASVRNGNKTQNFVAEYQEQRRMVILRDQVFSKYGKVKSRNIKITLCGDLTSLRSLRAADLGRVDEEDQTELITKTNRTLHNESSSLRMCACFSDDRIAVSLPNEKKIQFLTCRIHIPNGKKFRFTPSCSSITTKYYCDGLTVLGKDKVVISGYNDTGNKNYFWSIMTTSGKEEYYRDINQTGDKGTYLATNKSKTCIYMSCFDINTVYCFGLDGHLYFKYKSKGLKGPMGIGVDRDGNVYVVGLRSQNIHQLSQDGSFIKFISSGILTAPQKIAFSVDGLTSLITNQGEGNKCCIFKLQ
ncbi:hypothetical protein CHS0354_021993 [Potamilus streckersoni]|uniref:B box-type domain-containing protein n=1 Tax=Potamilus streckersoni TaxID=2493646 RepID=A0AAE0SK94_9BIVA|nr:hypothetical protein CHS0354_021993 [Potamilus streckersoni]